MSDKFYYINKQLEQLPEKEKAVLQKKLDAIDFSVLKEKVKFRNRCSCGIFNGNMCQTLAGAVRFEPSARGFGGGVSNSFMCLCYVFFLLSKLLSTTI